MNLDFLLLPAALLCLWLPSTVVAPSSVRTGLRARARRKRDGLRSLIRSKLNWFDAARAILGTWLLFEHVAFLRPLPGAEELASVLLGIKFAVLLIGTIVQTLWFDDETRVIGPLFYLSGLACVLTTPSVGLPAVVLGVNCALLLRRLRLSFLFVPMALGAMGVLFRQPVNAAFAAALFMLPGFLAFALDCNPAYVRRPVRNFRRRLLAWPAQPAQGTALTAFPPEAEPAIETRLASTRAA